MVITRRNNKVYAKVGIAGNQPIKLQTIVDTGTGLKFIRKDTMPDEIELITKYGALPKICNANANTIRMGRRSNLQV